ncbi:MAG: diguanylate cyclase [Treponema sp.]|nr:diguanylate cyclase [Treponema sp.]
MTENEKIFDDLGITLHEILDKAAGRFYGIYVMDTDNNKIIAIKSFYQNEFYEVPVVHEWDHTILEDVNKSMASKYRALALVMFDRQHLRKKFTDINQRSDFIFQRTTGEWNNVAFTPLRLSNGECSLLLVTFVDITDPKNKLDKMSELLELSHKDVLSSNWYFSMVAHDMYPWILKFDLYSGEVMRIVFEDNAPKELPMLDWESSYERLIESIHPKDLEGAKTRFSMKRLREMSPGEVLEYTFRRYEENKYQWFSVSIHISSVEPSIAVAFARNISSSSSESNQVVYRAEHDDLTDLFNIEKYAYLLATEYVDIKTAGVIYADIEGLAELNQKYGHEFGNEAIKIVADSFRSVQSRYSLAFRCGDDEFMLIAPDCEKDHIQNLLQLIKERFARLCDMKNMHFFASFGYSWKDSVDDVSQVISEAVSDMRNNKNIEILQ